MARSVVSRSRGPREVVGVQRDTDHPPVAAHAAPSPHDGRTEPLLHPPPGCAARPVGQGEATVQPVATQVDAVPNGW